MATENQIRHPKAWGQIQGMVVAQDGLNRKAYSEEWLANGSKDNNADGRWDYPLAASQEIGEFLDSWGYSWWSKADVDLPNCMTELVDAWHFLVSQAIIECKGNLTLAAEQLFNCYVFVTDNGVSHGHRAVVMRAKQLMAGLLTWTTDAEIYYSQDIYDQFFSLMLSAGFSLDHFTTRYNAKLQLNLFRQLNGYNTKPRQYKKIWTTDGKEDNYFLSAWIDKCLTEDKRVPGDSEIMNWIGVQYTAHTRIKSVMPHEVDTTGREDADE